MTRPASLSHKPSESGAPGLRTGWTEIGVAALFTLLVLYFHGVFISHAGGLWRDEANTVGLATLPSLGEIWQHLEFDSFPFLWPLVVRILNAIGLGSDPALRGLGLLMGLCVIASLWFSARTFRTGPPLVSLAIFALCPTTIIWGDCMRAHGCGVATSLVAYAFIWRFVEKGDRRTWIAAALLAILAVQTSYYNCIIVLAAGLAGFAVCLRRKRNTTGWLTLAAGIPAALSILPYLPVFHRASEWNVLIQLPEYNFTVFWIKLSEALSDAGAWTIWLWIILLILALVFAIAALISLPDWKVPDRVQDVILFNLVVLLVGVLAYYGFLKALHYLTQRWYYLPLLGFTAATIDAILGASCVNIPTRIARIAVSVGIFALLLPGDARAIPYRLTNVDLVADKLRYFADDKDLVVVDPWFCGITYERYNVSKAPWITLPAMDFHHFHRYDLIKQMMEERDQADPVRPVLERIRETLRANGQVYMVHFYGGLRAPPPNTRPYLLPPAPQTEYGWNSDLYRDSWTLQVGYFLELHATEVRNLEMPILTDVNHVNRFEWMSVAAVKGWKD